MPGGMLPSDPRVIRALKGGDSGSFITNIGKDLKGVLDPRNYVKAGSQLVHHPLGFAKAMGSQYASMVEHPVRSFEDHPINTLLSIAPLGKVATLGSVGKAAVEAGEGASARAALMKAAATHARMRDSVGGQGETALTQRLGMRLDPPVSHVSQATKAEGVARARSAHAIRDGLSRPTEFGGDPSLNFTNIKPDANAGIRHVTVTKDGKPAGHITYHQTSDGKWMVQQIRVPEALRRQGIGTELFRKAEADVGPGKLLHQNDPSLLSSEGAGFAKSFVKPPKGELKGVGLERRGTAMFQDGERIPTDPTAYKRWQDRRAVEYYAKQPEYKSQAPVNEEPAGPELFNENRKLLDLSREGRAAAEATRNRLNMQDLGSHNLSDLLRGMENAHAQGAIEKGDTIAGHIQDRFGFDPYEESVPMPNDPGFAEFVDSLNKAKRRGPHDPNFDEAASSGYHSKSLLQALMNHAGSPHWDAQSALEHLRNTNADFYSGKGPGTQRFQSTEAYSKSALEGPASGKTARRSYFKTRDSKGRADALIRMMREQRPSNN